MSRVVKSSKVPRLSIPTSERLRALINELVAVRLHSVQFYVSSMRGIPETTQELNHTPPFLRRSSALALRADMTSGASVPRGSAVLINGCYDCQCWSMDLLVDVLTTKRS
jgi:hypothetical protein